MNYRVFSKWCAYGFLSLVAFIFLSLALAFSPIGISTMASFANKQNGITIDGVDGSLYSQISISKVVIKQDAMLIDAENLKLDLSLNCLFVAKICVQNLEFARFDLTLLNSEDKQAPEPKGLRDYITLPVEFELERLYLSSFSLFSEDPDKADESTKMLEIESLYTRLFMFESLDVKELSINALAINQMADPQTKESTEEKGFELDKLIKMVKQFKFVPLDAPQVFIPINLNADNNQINRICLVEQASQDCVEDLQLSVQLQKQILKLQLALSGVEQLFKKAELSFEMDLDQQFKHSLDLNVTPNEGLREGGALAFDIHVDGNLKGVQLELKSTKENAPLLNLMANINVATAELPVDVSLSGQGLGKFAANWDLASIEILDHVDLKLTGTTQQYVLDATAQLISPQVSNLELNTTFSLANSVLEVNRLKSSGALGDFLLNSRIEINQQLQLASRADIRFDGLNIGAVKESLSSQLSGQLALRSTFSDDLFSASVDCKEIKGLIEGFELATECDVDISDNGLVKVRKFNLAQASNSISASGQIVLPRRFKAIIQNQSNKGGALSSLEQAQSDFTFSIDVEHLQDLSYLLGKNQTLEGVIKGSGSIVGNALSPKVDATILASKLAFQDISIEQLKLDFDSDLSANFSTQLKANIKQVTRGDDRAVIANDAILSINGDLAKHQLSFSTTSPEYSGLLAINGALDRNAMAWQGRLIEGEINAPFDTFKLANEFDIELSASTLLIDGHCWLSSLSTNINTVSSIDEQGLCIEPIKRSDTQTNINAKLSYDLAPVLMHFSPELILTGSELPLFSDIKVSIEDTGRVQADAYNVITGAKIRTKEHEIELVAIVANLDLEDEILQSNIFAGTQSVGAIGVSSKIELGSEQRIHSGRLRIDGLGLNKFKQFVARVEKLSGNIDGDLRFTGPLLSPLFNGDLTIGNGELVVNSYPYPLTNFNQKVTVVDNTADIEGNFKMGKGDAQYSGRLVVNENIEFKGAIKGKDIQLAVQDHQIQISPDLQIQLTPEQFDLKGSLNIPKALFKLNELPESAKTPSADQIVIGKPPEPPILPIGLNIDLNLLIDEAKESKVEVNALDLEAVLAGDLRLKVIQKRAKKENEFTPLETYLYGTVNILSGNYEAYGQMLQVRSGSIHFNGAPSLPQFDVTAIRNPLNTEDQVIAGVRISGNPVSPKLDLFSEPNMIQARQLSYLLQGTDITGGPGTSTNVQLINALVNYGVGSSENRVNKIGQSLGFDSLNLQTAGQGNNTQLQVTGRISDKIQVTYGVGLFDSVSVVILKYQLMPKLFIEAKSGVNSAVDLFYEVTRNES